jgi:phosphoribosyl 1,2-cyclic phosphodiesterase
MNQDFRLRLKFWGVRGSIPSPHPDVLGFGGNTTCIEIRLPGGELLIIDGGSGVRNLGLSLMEENSGQPLNLHFFLTHFHWDHIQGLPFFAPLYQSGNRITFHSTRPSADVREILEGQMSQPYSPVSFDMLSAHREFIQVAEPVSYGDLTIRPFPLHHPQTASGWRMERNGAVIVHASDTEHGHVELDRVIREYAQNADLLIYDSQYTPAEYETKKGWGHSTWLEATRIAREVGVKKLILFHHDPAHSDAFMNGVIADARACFENTDAAREGDVICV